MTTKKRENENARFVREVRLQLRRLGVVEGALESGGLIGYLAFASTGPYDHNRYDAPLPFSDMPLVFRRLYEAVEYANKHKEHGRIKIEGIDGTTVPGSRRGHPILAGKVVWQSWHPDAIRSGLGWEPG